MTSKVLCCINGVAGTIFRPVRSRFLTSSGVAGLGFALVGFGGFTPVPQQELGIHLRYTIQDLGVVGANPNAPGQPLVISNSGWIGGAAGVGAAEHAVLWYGGRMIDIGIPGLGGKNSFGYGVNDFGMSTGEAETSEADPTGEDFCGFQIGGFSLSPTQCVPFIWVNGRMFPLQTLGGVNGIATQINNSGAVAGYAENTTLDPGCTAPQKYQFKPVVWSNGRVRQLPTGKDADGLAFAINELGNVVGSSGTCAPYNFIWGFYFAPTHALLWQNGVATDLGNLGGVSNNLAHDINNLGQVVGGSDISGDLTSHAFLWTPGTKMLDLGTVDGDYFSFGLGINDAGQIVGVSANMDFSVVRAFVRQNGALVDLNSLVAGKNSLYLMTACSINSMGEIIGIAVDPNTGETHGYLAKPTLAL